MATAPPARIAGRPRGCTGPIGGGMKGNGIAASIRALFQTHFPLAFWAWRWTCHRATSAPPTPGKPAAARRETRRPSSKPSSSGGTREKMARPGSAMPSGHEGDLVFGRTPLQARKFTICQYYVNILQYVRTSPGTSSKFFGWCRPLHPSPWPHLALIRPPSLF